MDREFDGTPAASDLICAGPPGGFQNEQISKFRAGILFQVHLRTVSAFGHVKPMLFLVRSNSARIQQNAKSNCLYHLYSKGGFPYAAVAEKGSAAANRRNLMIGNCLVENETINQRNMVRFLESVVYLKSQAIPTVFGRVLASLFTITIGVEHNEQRCLGQSVFLQELLEPLSSLCVGTKINVRHTESSTWLSKVHNRFRVRTGSFEACWVHEQKVETMMNAKVKTPSDSTRHKHRWKLDNFSFSKLIFTRPPNVGPGRWSRYSPCREYIKIGGQVCLALQLDCTPVALPDCRHRSALANHVHAV